MAAISDILSALARGPKTTSDLLSVTGTHSGDVARTCAGLIKDGRVKRIDGTSGRGSRAIYALTEYRGSVPVVPKRGRMQFGLADPPMPSERVDRDPCFKCGIRADIGCIHSQFPPAHLQVHGQEAAPPLIGAQRQPGDGRLVEAV